MDCSRGMPRRIRSASRTIEWRTGRATRSGGLRSQGGSVDLAEVSVELMGWKRINWTEWLGLTRRGEIPRHDQVGLMTATSLESCVPPSQSASQVASPNLAAAGQRQVDTPDCQLAARRPSEGEKVAGVHLSDWKSGAPASFGSQPVRIPAQPVAAAGPLPFNHFPSSRRLHRAGGHTK